MTTLDHLLFIFKPIWDHFLKTRWLIVCIFGDYLLTTQWPPFDYTLTTWQPICDYFMTSWKPHWEHWWTKWITVWQGSIRALASILPFLRVCSWPFLVLYSNTNTRIWQFSPKKIYKRPSAPISTAKILFAAITYCRHYFQSDGSPDQWSWSASNILPIWLDSPHKFTPNSFSLLCELQAAPPIPPKKCKSTCDRTYQPSSPRGPRSPTGAICASLSLPLQPPVQPPACLLAAAIIVLSLLAPPLLQAPTSSPVW